MAQVVGDASAGGVGGSPSALHANQSGGSNLSYTPSGRKKRVGAKNTEIPETVDQEVLWEFFQTRTDFFGQVKIDKEAGFDELTDMWNNTRYLFGTIAFVMLFYNTYAIVGFNTDLLGLTGERSRGDERPGEPCFFNRIDIATLPERTFLLTQELFEAFADNSTIGSQSQRCAKIGAIGTIAYAEIFLLLSFYVWGGFVIFNMLFAQTECKKWHRVANFFFNVLPMIASLSMVKLLNWVTPAVLVPELLNAIKELFSMNDGSCRFAFYLASRMVCLFAGFDAFLYKFQILANYFFAINDPNIPQSVSESDTLIFALLFVNQMLGIVQLGWFTKQRIFIFIFAGEDGAMTNKELAIKQTWEAMVCYRIQGIHGWFKAVFFMLAFSDGDFQRMVLDDKDDDSGEKHQQERRATLEAQANNKFGGEFGGDVGGASGS